VVIGAELLALIVTETVESLAYEPLPGVIESVAVGAGTGDGGGGVGAGGLVVEVTVYVAAVDAVRFRMLTPVPEASKIAAAVLYVRTAEPEVPITLKLIVTTVFEPLTPALPPGTLRIMSMTPGFVLLVRWAVVNTPPSVVLTYCSCEAG
jgi:hypothetical protein